MHTAESDNRIARLTWDGTTLGGYEPLVTRHPEGRVPAGLTYTDGTLYMSALRGERLWRIPLDGGAPGTPEAYYAGELGRLRALAHRPRRRRAVAGQQQRRPGRPGAGADVVHEVTLE